MSSGIGLSLDTSFLQSLDEVDKKIKAISEGTDAISKKTIAAFQLMARNGVMPYVEQLEKQKKALEEIEKAAGKGTVMTSVKNEAKAAVDEINKVIDALKKTSAFRGEQSGRSAMSFAKSVLSGRGEVKSISNLQLALSQLEEAQNRVNLKTKTGRINYQKIGETIKQVKRELDEVTSSAKGTSGIISGLFSLNAIRSFISRLKEIRGEFEMQHRSLQVLLQDVDKANELWDKTVSLAVRSPFRVKELVTYTKQLAAYRVEADKLYDTNRMLADVSAGLGVDMNRLILAFGQVKAANYLRGTELRQFSEAGVNMLEELAKRFTELEGRAVSVGDVFERVSKRMVSFADVEAVFQRITSEGGAFYQMQERQSETLKGMLSNLQDSIDLMFNNIGQANDGVIKSVVQGIKALVDNWESVSSVALPVLSMMVARWRIFGHLTAENGKGILGFAKNLGKDFGIVATQLTKGKKAAQDMVAVGKTLSMSWVSAITAILAVIGTLYGVIRNITKVSRELTKIDLKGGLDASQAIAEYKRLSEIVRDSSKSYDEQQKALSILKTKYGEILPSHLLEAKTIREIGDNYEGATEAIKDYIATKTKEKQLSFISTEYGKDVEDQAKDLADDIKKALSKVAPNITRTDVLPIVNKLRELIQVGDVDLHNVDETIQDLVMQFTGLKISTTAWKDSMGGAYGAISLLDGNAAQLVVAVNNLKTAMDEVTSSSLSFQDSFINKDFNRVKDEYEKQSKAIGDYYDTIRLYNKELESKGVDNIDSELANQYKEALKSLNSIFAEAGKEAPKWNEIINEPFKLNEATIDANKILWQKMIGDIEDMPILPAQAAAKSGYIETLEREMNGFAGGQKQQEIARLAQGLADTMKVSLKDLEELFLGSEESLSDYAKKVSKVLEEYKQRLLMFDNDVKKGTYLSDLTPAKADLIKEQIPFLEKYLGYFEAFLKQQENAPKDTFTPMLRSVTELYEEFKRLQDSFDDLTAKEGALAKFGDAFKEAFGKTPEEMGFDLFSEEGAKKAYDYLISQAPDAKKKIQAQLAKGEIVWDVKLETKKDADEKLLDDIQKLFDRYDLSLELKNLNIPSELAKSLFDVDYLDLDGLKGAIEARKSEFLGKDMLKEYDELMKKIGDLQRKRQEDEAKEFIDFLKKNLNEIQIIQDKGAYNIALADKLFGQGKITAEQYMSSIRQIVDDTNKEVARVNLDKFKDSATYIKAMGNLAAYSRDELEGMINALQGQVGANAGNMGSDEIRAYYEALERLVEQYDKIESPFQKGEINDLIEYLNLQKRLNQEKEKEAALEQRKVEINNRLNLLQAQLKSQQERGDVLGAASTQRQIKSTVGELKEVDGQIVSVASNILVISERVEALGDGMVKSLAVAHKIVNEIANVANAATKIFDDVKSAADALGADTESGSWAKAGYAMEMVGGVSSELTSGLSNLARGDFAGALANVVGVVTKLVSGFAKIHDQNYQDIIEAQAEQVERLGKAYEKLETATESAYSIQQLQQYNEELERNVELQIASYKAMIAAENAKKDTDAEQIKAWNEEIEALTEQWDELKRSLIEGVGGVSKDNYRSQTRAFVDSWVSAFKETGDGLSGLKENFREFFDNIIAEQAALRVTEKFLAPFYNSLNTALDDLSLSVEESKSLREEADKIMPQLSEALELIWNQLGGSRGEAEGGLSGLQKGIQGITEDTAQIIEAYLNSMRGYISEQVTYTKRLYEMFDRMSRGTTYGLNVRMIS